MKKYIVTILAGWMSVCYAEAQSTNLLQMATVRAAGSYTFYARGDSAEQAITPFTQMFYPGGSTNSSSLYGLHANDTYGPPGREGNLIDTGSNGAPVPISAGELADGNESTFVAGYIDTVSPDALHDSRISGYFDVLFDLGAVYRIDQVNINYSDRTGGPRWGGTATDDIAYDTGSQQIWIATSLAGSAPADSDFTLYDTGTFVRSSEKAVETFGESEAGVNARYIVLRLAVDMVKSPSASAGIIGGMVNEVEFMGGEALPDNLLQNAAVRAAGSYTFFARGDSAEQSVTPFTQMFYPGGSTNPASLFGLHANDTYGPPGREGGLIDTGSNAAPVPLSSGELADGNESTFVAGYIDTISPDAFHDSRVSGYFDVFFDLGAVYRIDQVNINYSDRSGGPRWGGTATDDIAYDAGSQQIWTATSLAGSAPADSDFTLYDTGTFIRSSEKATESFGEAVSAVNARYVVLRLAVDMVSSPSASAGIIGGMINEVEIIGVEADVQPIHYDVYLQGGQSNADGRGLVSGLTGGLADWAAARWDVRFTYSNPGYVEPYDPDAPGFETGWISLAPGYSVPNSGTTELPSSVFGPEVSFGGTLADEFPDRNIAVIKVTKGGTSLQTDWDPDGTTDNYMWQTFTNQVTGSLAALTGAGNTVTLKGMVWHQGEADIGNSNYLTDLTNFLAAVRTFVGQADFPIVLGELEQDGSNTNEYDAERALRTADINAAAAADPYTGVVSSSGLTTSDGTHFDAASMIVLGERYAARAQDVDADDLPDEWETDTFGSIVTTDGSGDQDGDGMPDGDEYFAGTSPTNALSLLAVGFSGPVPAAGGDLDLIWSSISGRVYHVQSATVLEGSWSNLVSGITAVGPVTTQTVSVAESQDAGFYQILIDAE